VDADEREIVTGCGFPRIEVLRAVGNGVEGAAGVSRRFQTSLFS